MAHPRNHNEFQRITRSLIAEYWIGGRQPAQRSLNFSR